MTAKDQPRKNIKDLLLHEGVVTPAVMNEVMQEQGEGKESPIDILLLGIVQELLNESPFLIDSSLQYLYELRESVQYHQQ